jgi:hypothetical protein
MPGVPIETTGIYLVGRARLECPIAAVSGASEAVCERYTDSFINFRNLLVLRAKVVVNPYHLGSLDKETAQNVDGSIKLHDYGILTCSSQPFETLQDTEL